MTNIETALALIWTSRLIDEQMNPGLLASFVELRDQSHNYGEFGLAIAYRYFFTNMAALISSMKGSYPAEIELLRAILREFKNRTNWEEVGVLAATKLGWDGNS